MSNYEDIIRSSAPFRALAAQFAETQTERDALQAKLVRFGELDDLYETTRQAQEYAQHENQTLKEQLEQQRHLNQAKQMRAARERQVLEEKAEAIQADLEKLHRDYQDLESGKVTIKDLAVRNGSLTAEIGTEMAGVLAHQFTAVLDKVGAENYVEMLFTDKDDPSKRCVVIVQRITSKSPHQLRQEAEARVVAMQGKLDALAV